MTVGIGNGPVNAIDSALRKALISFYPSLKNLKLTDFKVMILSSDKGTGAVTRVLIESTDETNKLIFYHLWRIDRISGLDHRAGQCRYDN